MKLYKNRTFLFFLVLFIFFTIKNSSAGFDIEPIESDFSNPVLMGFFDLRDRETFIQITNPNYDFETSGQAVPNAAQLVHIQIFDVSNNCNENNFFDFYTLNDTHVYNLRDIQTNDGNPSGVVLPDDAYGIFVAFGAEQTFVIPPSSFFFYTAHLFGNLRIIDNSGYEYRANLAGNSNIPDNNLNTVTYNYNSNSGTNFSEVLIFNHENFRGEQEVAIADVFNYWSLFDVDIIDANENIFSCRNVIYSCVNENSTNYEALLEEVAEFSGIGSSVADIEYGINEALPHSKGGELLCPGNNISDGIIRLQVLSLGDDTADEIATFVGLNNGNGRGSMDSFWSQNNDGDS